MEALFYAVQGKMNIPGRGTEADYHEIFKLIVNAKGGIQNCLFYEPPTGHIPKSLMFIACESGSRKIVKDLIEGGAEVYILI